MFDKQINTRAKKNENLDVSIIGIKEAKIEDASIKSSIDSIKVKFSSEQVQVIKNDKGKIISGDGNQILSIVESWFFSMNLLMNIVLSRNCISVEINIQELDRNSFF